MKRIKQRQPPDVITAVRIMRRIRTEITRCPAAIIGATTTPALCTCNNGDNCTDCRHCRERIIRQIAKELK